MNEGEQISVGTKLYPDQKNAFDAARGEMNQSDAIREAMRLFCEQYGITFPMYETGGRGGKRRGWGKVVPRRVDKG